MLREACPAVAEHATPASAVLDFGLLTDAIHVGPDAHLEFQRLHVPNSGNRKLQHPTPRTRLHVAGAFALWPSVTLAKGSQVRAGLTAPFQASRQIPQACRVFSSSWLHSSNVGGASAGKGD